MKGRVVRVSGLQCLVDVSKEDYTCDLRGRMKAGERSSNSPVVVGDWVDFQVTGPQTGVIDTVQPRQSKISRAISGSKPLEQIIAANIDQLVVTVSAKKPALRPGFIDRALVMAHIGGVKPLVCINKIDLDPAAGYSEIAGAYLDLGYEVHETSAKSGVGIDPLKTALCRRVSAFLGYSGVGKSTLLNRIQPGLALKTNTLMIKHDRGRHVTSAVTLYPIQQGNGYVADTPGVKSLQPWGIEPQNLADCFVEMAPLVAQCRFRNCLHTQEPECAIRRAVEDNRIAHFRYEGYTRILDGLR